MINYYVELDYKLEDDLTIETGGVSHSEYTLEEFLGESDLLDKKDEILTEETLSTLNQHLKDAGIKRVTPTTFFDFKKVNYTVDGDILTERFTTDELTAIYSFFEKMSSLRKLNRETYLKTKDEQFSLLIYKIIEESLSDFVYDISLFKKGEDYNKLEFLENIHMINKQREELLYNKLKNSLLKSTLNEITKFNNEPSLFKNQYLKIFETFFFLEEITKEHIEEYLRKSNLFYINLDGDMVYSEYWDYRDSLQPSTIKHIIDYAMQYETSIISALYDYSCEHDWLSFDTEIFKVTDQYIDEYCDSIIDVDDLAIQDTVLDYINDIVKYEHNLEDLLNNSTLDDLTIYFGENWDDDYDNLSVWTDAHEEFEKNNKLCADTINDLENTTVGWLVKSQGYNVTDIFTNKDDEFCKQVYSELFEYETDLSGLQLIALPYTTDFEAILDLYNNKPVIIKKGTMFGLFNQIHGSGAGLEIKTVKDIELNDTIKYDIDIEYHESSYNYSPNCVYGYLDRPNKEQLERVGENAD